MKTEALLIIPLLMVWVMCADTIILYLDFFLDIEKKGKGMFFKVLKAGLKAKSTPAIIVIIMMIAAIIGIIWTIVTFSSIYGNIGGIISLTATVVIILVILYIMRRIKRS